MSRIKLTNSLLDSITIMVDGNPGAIAALTSLMADVTTIDPQSAFKELAPLLAFDTLEVYGTAIYIIWNDKCGRDNRKTLMLLRSVQLGFLSLSQFKAMAADQMGEVNLTKKRWEELDRQVCGYLGDFQKLK